MLLFFDQFRGVDERGANVFGLQIVFALNLFKGSAGRNKPDHDGDRGPRSADDWLSVANARIYDDTLVHVSIIHRADEFD